MRTPPKTLASIILTAALAIGLSGAAKAPPTPPTPASPPASEVNTAGSPTSCTAKTSQPTTLTEVNDPAVIADARTTVQQLLEEGDVTLLTPDAEVDYEAVTVMTVTSEHGEHTAITTPLTGPNISLTSNATFVLNSEQKVLTYAETILSGNNRGTFQLTSYTDGKMTQNIDTEHPYASDTEIQAQIDEVNRIALDYQQSHPNVDAQKAGTGEVAACLGVVLGISGGFAWWIASMCGGSCAAAATGVGAAICAACIGGVATLGAGAITGAVKCFEYM